MSLLSAHGIQKVYGDRTVLGDVSITIEERDRVGLIGVNGAGKSTLVRILVGEEEPDRGEIQRRRGLTMGMVAQSPALDPNDTVIDVVSRGLKRNARVRERLEAVSHALEAAAEASAVGALIEEQAALQDELERTGGWNVEHRAEAAMAALGVPPKDRMMGSLSLGELRRVALCAGLLEQPELLVLDEPTNHIDVEAIEWLEVTLAEYPGALVLVTHDRYFLDRVATRHAEIDRGEVRLYDGNYSEYLAARALREEIELRAGHRRERAIENELQWVRKRAPARTTKQKARLDRFDALVADRPKASSREAVFRLPHPERIGKTILELRGIGKAIGGKTLIDGLDLILKRGDRLGVIGPNGAGKTTLLRMIRGEIEPDRGTIVRGQNTAIAYADQRRDLDEGHTVIEEVAGDSDVVHVGEEAVSVYGFLEGLLFDGAAQRTKISALSGGERSRVALAKALRVRANVLILDEPTNDLDLPTLRVLEEALAEYPGCALLVSHDRYFLDRVTTGVLAFEGQGRVVLYEGGYDGYRARERAKRSATPASSDQPTPEPAARSDPQPAAALAPRARKRSYLEARELEGIETRILEAESHVSSLEAELNDAAKLRSLGAEIKTKVKALDAARRQVETLYERWAELEAIPGDRR